MATIDNSEVETEQRRGRTLRERRDLLFQDSEAQLQKVIDRLEFLCSTNLGPNAFECQEVRESSHYSAYDGGPSSPRGVDINTICAWLGHVSLNATNIYAEVDLEMKAEALATSEIRGTVPLKNWKEDLSLMQFLRAI